MPTFYSPEGNPEIWDNVPAGYFTEAEWESRPKPSIPEGKRAQMIREARDNRLQPTLWLNDRHRGQLEGGLPTTLSPEQYKALCIYQQALRDIPQQEGFPWDGDPDNPETEWPPRPEWLDAEPIEE